jgi:tRNA pseudouridine38-40 synthase
VQKNTSDCTKTNRLALFCNMRYFLEISYNGTQYHGWQLQSNAISVQEVIEKALGHLLGSPTSIVGSGRTDAGVHASQQFAHFDGPEIDKERLHYKLNAYLPKDISINKIHLVRADAHARFDAVSRSYQYHMHASKNPFKQGFSYFMHSELALDKISIACEVLENWTDFEAFSKVKTEVNNFNCVLMKASWKQTAQGHTFFVTSNRFLRGMVRALVGTLIEVGTEKLSIADFQNILIKRDRSGAGVSVPACGLFLSEVIYPKEIYQIDQA